MMQWVRTKVLSRRTLQLWLQAPRLVWWLMGTMRPVLPLARPLAGCPTCMALWLQWTTVLLSMKPHLWLQMRWMVHWLPKRLLRVGSQLWLQARWLQVQWLPIQVLPPPEMLQRKEARARRVT